MTPDELVAELKTRGPRPVYLLLGEERYELNRCVSALREYFEADAVAGLNEDDFHASEVSAKTVESAARTMPMMASRRWVMVRDVERWEAKGGSAAKADLDLLGAYSESPAPECLLVITAAKLNARRRLVSQAKKAGFVVSCESPKKRDLPRWVVNAAKLRGHRIDAQTADLLVQVVGSELQALDGALERLSLYLGEAQPITEGKMAELLPMARPGTVWQLVDAVGQRDIAGALATLQRIYEPQDRGLRLVGILAWSTRQLLRFEAARASGEPPALAAKAAGVPPFKARELEQRLKVLPRDLLERWLVRLAELDQQLKGGSKRPPKAILEATLIELCGEH